MSCNESVNPLTGDSLSGGLVVPLNTSNSYVIGNNATFVLPFDPVVIREALLREHYRGGQSFFVCPRVSDLKEVGEYLR